MVLVAACLGLRASEIVGLEWGDLNGEDLTLLVRRSVVHGRVGETKTEASRLPLPIDPRLADAFKEHWGRSVHRGPSDFVFANRAGKPRWQESMLQRQIKPAALRGESSFSDLYIEGHRVGPAGVLDDELVLPVVSGKSICIDLQGLADRAVHCR
jgi:integrase